MSEIRAVVSFDKEYFCVYGDGKLLAREKNAVVRKKTAIPSLVSFGKSAIASKDGLSGDKVFVRPFGVGGINDVQGAKLLIKVCFSRLFGTKKPHVFVLIPSFADDAYRSSVEKAFIDSGFRNVDLIEKPYVLSQIAQKEGKRFIVEIGTVGVEAVITESGVIKKAYALNFGTSETARLLIEEVCKRSETVPGCKNAEISHERTAVPDDGYTIDIGKYFSLYKGDCTRVQFVCKDAICDKPKAVGFAAKDVFETVSLLYERTAELVFAMLRECDAETVRTIKSEGVLFIGDGCKIGGFSKFMTERTEVATVTDEECLPIAEFYGFSEDEQYVARCLGVEEGQTKKGRK